MSNTQLYAPKSGKKTGSHFKMKFANKMFLAHADDRTRPIYRWMAIEGQLADAKAEQEGSKDHFRAKEKKSKLVKED